MINQGVVDRYSKALLELSEDIGKTEVILEEFKRVSSYFEVSDELIAVFNSKKITLKEKIDIVKSICVKENLSELLSNFILVMIRGKRGSYISPVFKSYSYRVKRMHNLYQGVIKCARPLSETEIKDLTQRVKDRLNEDVEFEIVIDESLVGGVSIEIEGVVYKDDLKFRVESLKEWMKG